MLSKYCKNFTVFKFLRVMILKIIVLQGKNKTGKSKTITRLVGLLLFEGAFLKKTEHVGEEKWDRFYLLEYKNKKIGITTRGDGPKYLSEDFANFKSCDVCVCAAHPTRQMNNFIESQAEPDDIQRIDKAILNVENCNKQNNQDLEKAQDELNKQQAINMLDIINEIIA